MNKFGKQYVFDEISNLHLFDLKSQKKGPAYKRFFNIPLSHQ
jgi:hypothetical protein